MCVGKEKWKLLLFYRVKWKKSFKNETVGKADTLNSTSSMTEPTFNFDFTLKWLHAEN